MLLPVFLMGYNLLVLLMTLLYRIVIVTSLYMHILYLLKRSDSFTFLSEFRGEGVLSLRFITSPYMASCVFQ